MALSGRIYKNVGARWRLSLEWSASQDISNNRSTVTTRMYWESLDGYGTVYSSDSKSGATVIDGSTYTFSSSAALSGRQKKLVYTKTRTLSHDSDGSKSFTLDGYFDTEVSLAGTYYGRVNLTAKRFYLNTIPRASSLSSSANWTAGSNKSISINRASSSFTHTVKMYVNGYLVKTASNVGSSVTMNFNTTENTEVFDRLSGRASEDTKIEVITYNGGKYIGTDSKTGTVTAPYASTVSSVNGEMTKYGNERDVWTDQTMTFGISRRHSGFTHTLKIYASGTLIKTLTGVGTSVSWTPTSSERAAIHNEMTTSPVRDGDIEVITYYNGEVVRSSTSNDINFYIRDAEPSIPSSYVTYKDTNSVTVAITGDSSQIIQNKSNLSVTLSGTATAYQGASISKYEVSVNGITKSSTTYGTFTFGEISASRDTALSVTVTDSRGFKTTVTKTITVVPYAPPRVSVEAERLNGFERETTVEVSGTITSLNNNVNYVKNATAHYVDRDTGATAGTVTLSPSGYPSFTADPFIYNLDNQRAYDIVVSIEDVLSTVNTIVTVEAGRPILFIDSEKGSVGIGDFPIGENELLISGRIVFGSTHWASASQGEGAGGALFMNNSDITGINGLWMGDITQGGNGEGILFLKSGSPYGSGDPGDYDALYMRNGVLYTNNDEGVTTPTLHVQDGSDVSGTDSGGLTIGAARTSGGRMKLDRNEISVYSDSSPSPLYLNPDGGEVIIGFNNVNGGSDALQVEGAININGNGSNSLNIYAEDHAYIQWFAKGSSTRSGYLGWSAGYHNNMYIVNDIGDIGINANGTRLDFTSDAAGGRLYSDDVYNRTYSSAPNMYITGSGTLGRSTSASKYKLNIETVETDGLAENILYLQPKSWYDKTASEVNAEFLTRLFNGEDIEDEDIPYLERHYGLIAEDLVDLGLDMYVQYGEPDENGKREIEGIEYDRLWTMLLPVIRKQREQIKSLEEVVNGQQEFILSIESRVDALENN